jgi:hypothetical protein
MSPSVVPGGFWSVMPTHRNTINAIIININR